MVVAAALNKCNNKLYSIRVRMLVTRTSANSLNWEMIEYLLFMPDFRYCKYSSFVIQGFV